MGAAYLLIYLLQLLSWALYVLLAVGVPLLILWKLLRSSGLRRWVWLGVGVFWAVPSAVELVRDQQLERWTAAPPPAPTVVMEPGALLVLENGTFDAKHGVAHFTNCPDNRWQSPLCQFELGVGEALLGYGIAFAREGQVQKVDWVAQDGCDVYQRYTQQPEPFSAFFASQGICPQVAPVEDRPPDHILRYHSDTIPGFPGERYGQITLLDGAGDQVLSTLTSFTMDRPEYPALWGLHWAPVLRGVLPPRTTTLRYGETYEQADHLGHPKGSLQDMVLAHGWENQVWRWGDVYAALEDTYGYDADRALPALRTNGFFPSRFALETVCHERFRVRITPQVKFQIVRIANLERDISNGLPNQLAKDALQDGCVVIE